MIDTAIDTAIDRLFAALAAAGTTIPGDPVRASTLADVSGAIAPLTLPDDLVSLWSRFQTGPALEVLGHGLGFRWQTAEAGLADWQGDREGKWGYGETWPRCLFPLSYCSWCFLLVELDVPGYPSTGGALWQGSFDDMEILPIAPSLVSAVESMAQGWEWALLAWDGTSGTYANDDADSWRAYLALRHDLSTIDKSPLSWPARWQASSGIDVADTTNADTTTPIADLPPAGEGTIRGRVGSIAGNPDGLRAEIDDGSGRLTVWIPWSADPFRVAIGGATVELDVRLTGGGGADAAADFESLGRSVSAAALAEQSGVQEAAQRLSGLIGPDACAAVAAMVRPVS
ncbi:MAG: hypothetical protein SGJ13_01750 [Actinomycetota bacterium]|nr:hypothetical protein [Actinomycetota bacterium]